MFVSDCLNINAVGHLTIGGLDTVELAEKFGTPVYVMDEDAIRGACRSYVNSIDKFYGGKGGVAYASKAFCCKAMCKLAQEENLLLDIVSIGELHTALSAGFPPEKMFFHGNNKTVQELTTALEQGVGRIVVDNPQELEILNELAVSRDMSAEVLFRIKPGIDAHTHAYIRTGQIDSKFGFALETGEALEAVQRAVKLPGVKVKGIHCHIGSQIFDVEPFEEAARVMLGFMAEVKSTTGLEMEELDLGGGFGIKYLPDHDPVAYEHYMELVSKVIKSTCDELGLQQPFVVIEPGRSIVGQAGITLYKVGAVKEIPGVRTYVSVDGGMGDNPRYILYRSEYDFMVAGRASEPKDSVVTVAGKCCETGDLLGENVPIQQVRAGDVIAVLSTGAYNYSMASNYNRIPRPPVVFVKGGQARVVIKGESLDDLIRNDLF